jgi:hypothetical protein
MVLELRGVACLGLEEVTPDRKSLFRLALVWPAG